MYVLLLYNMCIGIVLKWAYSLTRDLILDAITSIAPKFSSTTNIQGFKTQLFSSFDMLCPAQGYPVPISRWVRYYNDLK